MTTVEREHRKEVQNRPVDAGVPEHPQDRRGRRLRIGRQGTAEGPRGDAQPEARDRAGYREDDLLPRGGRLGQPGEGDSAEALQSDLRPASEGERDHRVPQLVHQYADEDDRDPDEQRLPSVPPEDPEQGRRDQEGRIDRDGERAEPEAEHGGGVYPAAVRSAALTLASRGL